MADQDLSRRRQDQFFRQPLKQRSPQLGFQRQDLPADGGRRDIEMAGRLSDRSGAGDLVNISEQSAVQHDRAPGRPYVAEKATHLPKQSAFKETGQRVQSAPGK